jgi:hypothetical protein
LCAPTTRRYLRHCGINCDDTEQSLVFSHNRQRGEVTIKKAMGTYIRSFQWVKHDQVGIH